MSYEDKHPTHFRWRDDVRARVNRLQAKWPWKTYVNTYEWHPPYNPPTITRRYDAVSFDVWGGGLDAKGDRYLGYRGKPLPKELGVKIFRHLFYDPDPPDIYWIIWWGRMWVKGKGWGPAPSGPPDSDPEHNFHIHITYMD